MKNQSSQNLFMIEPEVFYSNNQTIDSNHYQFKNEDGSLDLDQITDSALTEFNNLKNEIEKHGIKVTFMKGISDCPDHIFPNWFITFEDKTFQLFSMRAENRRLEKTKEMIDFLASKYTLNGDLTDFEKKICFLRQLVAWFLIELIELFMQQYHREQMRNSQKNGVMKIIMN